MLNVEKIKSDINASKLEIELASKKLRGETYMRDTDYALSMLDEAIKRLDWATNELLKAES